MGKKQPRGEREGDREGAKRGWETEAKTAKTTALPSFTAEKHMASQSVQSANQPGASPVLEQRSTSPTPNEMILGIHKGGELREGRWFPDSWVWLVGRLLLHRQASAGAPHQLPLIEKPCGTHYRGLFYRKSD